jgi:DUF2917 family protein
MDYTCVTHRSDASDTPQVAAPRAGERRLDLAPDKTASVAAARGTAVRCLSGRLWLTQEGHWRDYVLVPGVSYVSHGNGKIVLNSPDAASAASIYRIDPAPTSTTCDARLHLDAGVIARIERQARRARAAEIARWFAVLLGALSTIWDSITAPDRPRGD